jgi:hypothetical protein
VSEEPEVESAHDPGVESVRDRLLARCEQALGHIAQDLIENPWVNSVLGSAMEARGKATQAQEVAMDFLNLPSAAQIERLARRVRSTAQRLESVEDALTRIEDGLRATPTAIAGRLGAIEEQLAELTRAVSARGPGAEAVSEGQERLAVPAGGDAPGEHQQS